MSLCIRQVDMNVDRERLLAVLQRNLLDVPHASRLPWLYLDNPSGTARSWLLCDEGGSAVGVTSLFPRAVWMNGKLAICGQVGDFGVDSKFRSLGPALMLQRATFEPVLQNEMAFCYDCPPHDLGMAMFQRLGLSENCRMQPYVKPLRADRHLQRMLGPGAGKAASILANPVLRLCSRLSNSSRGFEFVSHQGDFGQEFTELDEEIQANDSIRNRRSADDLNWRFRRDPLRSYEVFVARKAGRLLAYAVFTTDREDAFLFDVFGRIQDGVGARLLQALTDILHRRRLQTVRALLTTDDRHGPIFREAGFSPRGFAARVVAFGGPPSAEQTSLLRSASWHFQHSDVIA